MQNPLKAAATQASTLNPACVSRASAGTPERSDIVKPVDPRTTVGQLVAERPGRARVFERFGIDYCCGGKVPLQEACAASGTDAQEVVRALNQADASSAPADGTDSAHASLAELITNILETHHAHLRRELPRLTQMAGKVLEVHGTRHPELSEVQAVYNDLRAELQMHMMKEEQVLFPMIRAMEADGVVAAAHCGSVQNPIRVMEHEHDSAGAALLRLRTLTGGYTPPADACNTYRAFLSGLAELEQDLHQHIHKENNILFPRAAELEATLSGTATVGHDA